MEDTYAIERIIEIWNNKGGEHWEVGLDRDGLNFVELREYNKDDIYRAFNRLMFDREVAIKIAESIIEFCKDDRNFPNDD